ncbi:hypothetical protein B1790_07585 [Mycobacterium sp. AT1]|nr:hypothetical protein B1790_07585 [Mycobacterium sp. AT1]
MVHWTTAGLGPDEQATYWADVICAAFTPLSPSRQRSHRESSAVPDGVPGWVSSSPLGATNSAEISSCTQLLTHGAGEVKRSTDEVLFVNFQLAGSCRAEQDERRCVVERGSFAVFDSTRPFSQEYRESASGEPWRVLSFRIPRDEWFDAAPSPAAVATPISGTSGSGAAVGSLMTTLWSERMTLSTHSATMMGRAFTGVLVSAIGHHAAAEDVSNNQDHAEAVVRVAKRYIRNALPFGRVTATEAARRASISVRSLHRAFQAHGSTFAECVREERFQGAKLDLESASEHTSVADVAARWGYCDSSHLTRTFRQRLSCTPSDYRSRQLDRVGLSAS